MNRHVFLVTLELVVEAKEYDSVEAASYVEGTLLYNLQGKDKAENVTAYKLDREEHPA